MSLVRSGGGDQDDPNKKSLTVYRPDANGRFQRPVNVLDEETFIQVNKRQMLRFCCFSVS